MVLGTFYRNGPTNLRSVPGASHQRFLTPFPTHSGHGSIPVLPMRKPRMSKHRNLSIAILLPVGLVFTLLTAVCVTMVLAQEDQYISKAVLQEPGVGLQYWIYLFIGFSILSAVIIALITWRMIRWAEKRLAESERR